MLSTRVIPVLLLDGKKLVKTVKFDNPNYLGDPINAVKIFNDKEVDELIFLDINASRQGLEPQYDLIQKIATECFMPFGYGGGIDSYKKAKKVLHMGAEKIIINSAALDKDLLREIADDLGSQSLVISIDVKTNWLRRKRVYLKSGSENTKMSPVEFAKYAVDAGAGEIFVNSIDKDGTMEGYDIDLIKEISDAVNIPVVACGGASDLSDMQKLVEETNVSGVAAGSMFVYHGPHNAVLINYPSQKEIKKHLDRRK